MPNLDELKYRADKMLVDLFYQGMETGENEVLQYQFERDTGLKARYITRCLKVARDELADILTQLTDMVAPDSHSVTEAANPQPNPPNNLTKGSV